MSLPSSNTVYPKAKEGFLSGAIDLLTTNVGVYAVGSGYSYSDTDEFVSVISADILTGGGPIIMSSIAVTAGVVTASPMVADFTGPSGGNIMALVVAEANGAPSTDRLLAIITRNADTTPMNEPTSGTDLPYTFTSNLFYI